MTCIMVFRGKTSPLCLINIIRQGHEVWEICCVLTAAINIRPFQNDLVKSVLGLLLLAAVFVMDLLTPLGVADGMSYVIVILLTIWVKSRAHTFVTAFIALILVVLGYHFSPASGEIQIAIANRLLSVLCILAATLIISKYKKSEEVVETQRLNLEQISEKLQITNANLENEVQHRTMVLKEALDNLERSKQDLNASLEHEKELNALKSRFVSMASHEFRTPLATILSSLSLTQKYVETNDREKQLKHIKRMKEAVSHLIDLLEDTLSVSKLEEGKVSFTPEKINIEEFTSMLVQEMQVIAKMGQIINYTHIGPTEIINDSRILKRIMLNLLSNAIKFSKENAEIQICTRIDQKDLILIVKDSGIGIPENDLQNLFQRFFRAENAFNIQGTGLGLNIISKYVELLSGAIKVDSKLDYGTTLTVEIPKIAKIKSENSFA